ncbi:hypothetical protein FJY63_04695 [Candidatus Sumerlaeota bacterium]|nr:hypothetical protein [Candidatus Sumerlaeota bacterium]
MGRRSRGARAFVFMAVLGTMAVAIILAFAMSSTTQHSYSVTGLRLLDVQEDLLARSAAEYALAMIRAGRMAADEKPTTLTIRSGLGGGRSVEIGVDVRRLSPADQIYKAMPLVHRPGDVAVHVASSQLQEEFGVGDRYLLANLEGRRLRSLPALRK